MCTIPIRLGGSTCERRKFYLSVAHGYRGVIIGWDLKARASKKFIEKEWTNNPNYAVLIDARDRMVPQLGYLAQANIELHKGRIIHSLLNNYMEKYDEETQKWACSLPIWAP
uniref:YccV-like domain-containing protein n=1 Tax=Angiostrongylus cantonensis TaxID=6313 RepID=A0A0K0DB89_ANGCA